MPTEQAATRPKKVSALQVKSEVADRPPGLRKVNVACVLDMGQTTSIVFLLAVHAH